MRVIPLSVIGSLAMMSVASAADLPMKAKAPAVQYVKICSLYGAGFYYIPGTDTCLKIGGYIRTQVESHSSGGGTITGTSSSSQGLRTRTDTNDVQYRLRAVVTFDARTQGEYGTLRSYYRVGWEGTTPSGQTSGTSANAYWDRAFIQFAGFTIGKAQSFFDIYYSSSRTYANVRTSGQMSSNGLMLWAYTAQFGNGFSATLSLEDPRGHNLAGVYDSYQTNATVAFGGMIFGSLDNGLSSNVGGNGFQVPDIVANLRVDQPWGFFGVSGALHQVAGGYYTQNPGTTCVGGLNANTTACGHPEDKWGWAVSVGAQLNVPGLPGDTVGAGFVYTEGAVGYAISSGANNMLLVSGNTISRAFAPDAIFGIPGQPGGGDLHLTQAWSVNAHYEHAWTRSLKTSVYGGYAEITFPGAAKTVMCTGPCTLGRNPDYSFWLVGSRTQWSPWAGQLNIGVDVAYTQINSATSTIPAAAGGAWGGAPKLLADNDNLLVMFRVQRNWYP